MGDQLPILMMAAYHKNGGRNLFTKGSTNWISDPQNYEQYLRRRKSQEFRALLKQRAQERRKSKWAPLTKQFKLTTNKAASLGHQFVLARCDAKKRGISWSLTMEQWFAKWVGKGKRGQKSGQFVLARLDKTKPYDDENSVVVPAQMGKTIKWAELAQESNLTIHQIRLLSRRYTMQKVDARRRKIAWQFTFKSWVRKWIKSGLLANRGRKQHEFVMARYGDEGPYSPENTEIITQSQNGFDKERTRRKQSKRRKLALQYAK